MSDRIARGREAVEGWVRSGPGWGPEQAEITHLPQLATPHFDIFVVSQRQVSGPAGEIYLFSDGERATPGGGEGFAALMRAEGVPARPDALPATLVARLLLTLGAAGQGRPIEDAGDPALGRLAEPARAEFRPPAIEKDGDGAALTFWAASLHPGQVEAWRARIAADGTADIERSPIE